jgi:hypothetical protein
MLPEIQIEPESPCHVGVAPWAGLTNRTNASASKYTPEIRRSALSVLLMFIRSILLLSDQASFNLTNIQVAIHS